MRVTAFLAALMVAAISHVAHANEDPLAPAKAGKLWCYEPNSENKTCRSFSRFEWDAAGTIWEEDEIAFSENPLVSMKVRATTTLDGVSICQDIAEETFRKAVFMVDGKPATADETWFTGNNTAAASPHSTGRNSAWKFRPMKASSSPRLPLTARPTLQPHPG